MKRWMKELGKSGGGQSVANISLMLLRYRGIAEDGSQPGGVKSTSFSLLVD